MRILELHVDYVNYSARQKAFKAAEELAEGEKGKEKRLENCLVVFCSVEQGDNDAVTKRTAQEIKKNFDEVKAQTVLIYPYAHLSSNLAPPGEAVPTLNSLLDEVRAFAPNAQKSPFGWYKAFELKCKGHPLSELSKTINAETLAEKKTPKQDAGNVLEEFALAAAEKIASAKTGKEHEKVQRTGAFILAKAVRSALGGRLVEAALSQDGFYADFDSQSIGQKELSEITKAISATIESGAKLSEREEPAKALVKEFEAKGEAFQALVASRLPKAKIISDGEYSMLSLGPVEASTKSVHSVIVQTHGGAYLAGREGAKSLQRIYCRAFKTLAQQAEYEKLVVEAERRDHRKLGVQLDLFSMQQEAPGMPFYHPNGMILRNAIEKYWREEHEKEGYLEIKTPIILNESLWRQSGHWDHYKENMYFTQIDSKPYAVKPMNCPGCILVYKNSVHSYRELPLRIAEMGLVHRHELSGVLSGLFRVRAFTQDDAHLFVTEEQIGKEVVQLIKLFDRFYKTFGFKHEVELSTRPEKAMGSKEMWDKAEDALKKALKAAGIKYEINEGDGAFYGPKLDFKLSDAIGRKWQCGTIQLDFQMPEKFDLYYEASDGTRKRPAMLHRVVLGSFERFLGVLIEHYAGDFPPWLAPCQAAILPMTEGQEKYADKVLTKLKDRGLRAKCEGSRDKLESRIRNAQLKKIPYTLVLGAEEEKTGTVSIRTRDAKVEKNAGLDAFVERLAKENAERKN